MGMAVLKTNFPLTPSESSLAGMRSHSVSKKYKNESSSSVELCRDKERRKESRVSYISSHLTLLSSKK